ncbi:hypothetical protein DFH09DRAFT_1084855 [Mycena vulgaris]|nr:hypothetical protein DFH09DRAFT_1084855 [Mycena vulgaris]
MDTPPKDPPPRYSTIYGPAASTTSTPVSAQATRHFHGARAPSKTLNFPPRTGGSSPRTRGACEASSIVCAAAAAFRPAPTPVAEEGRPAAGTYGPAPLQDAEFSTENRRVFAQDSRDVLYFTIHVLHLSVNIHLENTTHAQNSERTSAQAIVPARSEPIPHRQKRAGIAYGLLLAAAPAKSRLSPSTLSSEPTPAYAMNTTNAVFSSTRPLTSPAVRKSKSGAKSRAKNQATDRSPLADTATHLSIIEARRYLAKRCSAGRCDKDRSATGLYRMVSSLERVAVEKQNIEILVQIGAGRETECVNPPSRGFRGGFNVDKSWSYGDGVARKVCTSLEHVPNMDESSCVLSVSVLYPAGARWLSLRGQSARIQASLRAYPGGFQRVKPVSCKVQTMCVKSRGIEFVRMLVALELYEIPREEVTGDAVGVVQGGFPRGGAQRVRFPEEYPNADSCSPNRVIVSCQVRHSRVGAREHTQSVWDPHSGRECTLLQWVMFILPPVNCFVSTLFTMLNPTIKLQWLRENWSTEDAVAAKFVIRASMLEYRKEHRLQSSHPSVQLPATATRRAVNPLSASHAARAQSKGFARFNALAKSLSGSDLELARDSPPAVELTEQEKAEAERRTVAEDERIVDKELGKYEGEGVIDESSPEFDDLDLLRCWEEQINFCDGLVAMEEELSVVDIDPKVIDDLLRAGRTQELEELVNSSWASAPA